MISTLDLPVDRPGSSTPERVRPAGKVEGEATNPAGQPHVVGVDLSLTSTGIAHRHGVHLITSKGHHADTLDQRSERLARLRNQIIGVCKTADLVVLEAPSYSSQGAGTWDRAGLWWLVVRGCHANDVPVAAVTPSQRMTYATGKGRADKDAVLAAVIKRYPDVDITSNDTADAFVLYAMGRDYLGHPLAELPATHRRAIDTVTWPVVMSR